MDWAQHKLTKGLNIDKMREFSFTQSNNCSTLVNCSGRKFSRPSF